MRNGAAPETIAGWRREALPVGDVRGRAALEALTLRFARLAGNYGAWRRALRGWDEEASRLEQVRTAGRRAGMVAGQAKALRQTILHLGRQRFGRPPTRRQYTAATALTNLSRLERISQRLLDATSWADLLATP
jgi:hypothetical protein